MNCLYVWSMKAHSVHVCRLFFCTLHMHSINFLARILEFIFSELYLKICFNIVCIALNCHIIWYFFVWRDIKAFNWFKKIFHTFINIFLDLFFSTVLCNTIYRTGISKKHRQQNVKFCLFNYKQIKYIVQLYKCKKSKINNTHI